MLSSTKGASMTANYANKLGKICKYVLRTVFTSRSIKASHAVAPVDVYALRTCSSVFTRVATTLINIWNISEQKSLRTHWLQSRLDTNDKIKYCSQKKQEIFGLSLRQFVKHPIENNWGTVFTVGTVVASHTSALITKWYIRTASVVLTWNTVALYHFWNSEIKITNSVKSKQNRFKICKLNPIHAVCYVHYSLTRCPFPSPKIKNCLCSVKKCYVTQEKSWKCTIW